MTDHEKRIREALAECSADGDTSALISTADLRALLADLDEARAALTAAKAGGWVAVPVEPTPEMIREVEHAARLGAVWTAASVYKAMLEARPTTPPEGASMTTPQPAALPEPTQEQLGTPAAHADYSLGWFNVGWARCMAERARDAMWAERLAALQPKPADVSDAEISRLWSWSATAEAERTATTQQHAFAYALLALRPQAVPMTDEQRQQAFNNSWATSADFFAGIVAAEAHYFGITAQGAQGEQA